MGFKLSAGLGLALLLLAGSFKMYYDKTQAEIESFHLQLEVKDIRYRIKVSSNIFLFKQDIINEGFSLLLQL